MNKFESNLEQLKEIEVNGFAYELIREVLLPDILGQDHSSMMYFAGKLLARKFPQESWEKIPEFFHDAGWGTLTMVHSKNRKLSLSSKVHLYQIDLPIKRSHAFRWKQVLLLNKSSF